MRYANTENYVFRDSFSALISYGDQWVNLNDGNRFKFRADGYGQKSQTLRRITVDSPYFDGTYSIHTTKENVNESVMIEIRGASQNIVTENMLLLLDCVAQDTYQIRFDAEDHRETWQCEPADYTVDRSQVLLHNRMATVTLSIPRLPDPIYELKI